MEPSLKFEATAVSGDGAELAAAHGEDLALRELPIGRVGVWWFLASEIMVFGGLIAAFVLLRIAHGGWEAEAQHVQWRIGAFNTLVLLTSSLTMMLALRGARADRPDLTSRYLGATVLLGVTFLGVKAWEYSIEISHGYTPDAGLFWSFYYLMTGLHALHVFGGIVANAWLWTLAATGRLWPRYQARVKFAGLYWHFVDIVWIFLFPLIYLS